MLQQRASARPAGSRASRGGACFKPVRRFVAVRDSNNGSDSPSSPMISEDVLARLRAAEDEAAKLRQQLAAVQGDKVGAARDCRPLRAPPAALCGPPAAHRFAGAGHAG